MNTSYSLLVEVEDILQESELIKLQGKKPNKGLITQKLNRVAYDHTNIDDFIPPTDEGYEVGDYLEQHVIPDVSKPNWLIAQEKLVDWALDQTQQVQRAIAQFLENPIENYELTLQALILNDVIQSDEGELLDTLPMGPKISYVSILKKRVKSRPATKEELIEEMSRYPINRPATTVRQFLRRHKNLLEEIDGYYHWVG